MNKLLVSDKVYDALKWFLGVCLCPLMSLIVGLGELYGFETAKIVGTITLIGTFLSAIFGISITKYNKSQK